MKKSITTTGVIAAAGIVLSLVLGGCDSGIGTWEEGQFGPNPFLEEKDDSVKADTGYLNARGVECHVTLEADIQAPSYQIFNAPPELAQFAVTYLRERDDFYLEILAEDATAPDRVEWLVDGSWLTRQQAEQVDASKLTHFRMRPVNAVVMDRTTSSIAAGQTFQAKVPLKPYSIYQDARDACATPDSHISLDQSVYWYLWNPESSGCQASLLQTMTLTIDEVLPQNPPSYPEYDQLWADGKLDVVVVFGKLDDGDVKDDYNWTTFNQLVTWLTQAGFAEEANAPLGRRFSKTVGEKKEVVDVYGPDVFYSVADYAHLPNWQKAVSEHEVIMYNGHSVLGTGMAFENVQYPDMYQIFQVASCLSYEYYVRPVLAGKGSWDTVDVVSNVEPTYYSENLPLTSTILAKIMYGFENGGRASWQDIMEAVSRKMGHSRFGVSGARGNCFSPDGNRCEPGPGPDPTDLRYENRNPVMIPDNNTTGVTSSIEVPGSVTVGQIAVEVDISHTYSGDVMVALSHNGTDVVLWNREGGSNDNVRGTFNPAGFNGKDASGTWTLKVSDRAGQDIGTLNGWAVVITPGTGTGPDPDPVQNRYENNAPTDIPDNNQTGIGATIDVPDQMNVSALSLELSITHSYIGDLQVVLSHGGTDHVVWNRQGGGAADIQQTFEIGAFNGKDASGTWTLKVKDLAAQDAGRLMSFALVITPAS